MEQLIKFRMQASTLSLDEYRTFLCNVLDESTMSEFSCMIFNHLHQKSKQSEPSPSSGLQINKINHEISSIVSQRQLNDTESDSEGAETDDNASEAKTNINHITDVLIQEIASFLPFKSYSNFQSCNRSIFYATNTPSTLYELDDVVDIEACVGTDNNTKLKAFMKRFERIQKLTIDENNEEYIPLIQYRNLKHLYLCTPNDIEPYLAKNTINWSEIQTLYFDTADTDTELEILKRCKNLRTLIIEDCGSIEMSDQLADLDCLSNLQCFGLISCDIIDTRIVLKNISNTLLSLVIQPRVHNVDGLTFHHLIELHLIMPLPNNIMTIIKNTKHLKRLGITMNRRAKFTDFALAFRRIFELKTLEYCSIIVIETSDAILRELACLIETSFHNRRDRLKLKLNFALYNVSLEQNAIHRTVLRIFNTLCNWCKKDFMLLVELGHVHQSKELPALNQWLNDISSTFAVHADKRNYKHSRRWTKQRIVISNKCNIFDGYEERLIVPSWFLWCYAFIKVGHRTNLSECKSVLSFFCQYIEC
eukprot:457946_1